MVKTTRVILRFYTVLVLLVCCTHSLKATHNRAGEIVYEQIGPLTIRATIKTYTKNSNTAVDRDSLELFWGDGTSTVLSRSNGPDNQGEVIPGRDIKVNCYVGEHTYATRASYTLSFEDPNRVEGILNVNFPNSIEIPFYLETTFTLLNSQFQGVNNSVVLLEPPLDFGCKDKRFIHNPNAYDIDGDSIAYELVVPRMSREDEVPNYQYPNEILPSEFNTIELNELTGDFVWDAPQAQGEYNIAIRVKEYRNGQLISSTIRDMQITIENCTDNPPIIESEERLCVIAGESIDLPLQISDPDEGDEVILTASGGPFVAETNPATLSPNTIFQTTPYQAQFTWQTDCSHIQKEPYQVVVRAEDSYGLVNLHTISITVMGPPPEIINVGFETEVNTIKWTNPYACDTQSAENFLGFSVWRRENSNQFELEECETGLEGKGYERIEYLTSNIENDSYTYHDTITTQDVIYCYRITALFAKSVVNNYPVNLTESKPSNEECSLAERDIPFITKASVTQTDAANGAIDIEWIMPSPEDYDTLRYIGPYTVSLLGGMFGSSKTVLAEWQETYFNDLTVTTFVHSEINTLDQQWDYTISLTSSDNTTKESNAASTIFLTGSPADTKVTLNWTVDVPWYNDKYDVYKRVNGNFELIATTAEQTYLDQQVENGVEECYLVTSRGYYSIATLPQDIVNDSQVLCVTPIDNEAPCPPPLSVVGVCQKLDENPLLESYFNSLTWSHNLIECPDNTDIAEYTIYYSETRDGEYSEVITLDSEQISFDDESTNRIGGCYIMVAIDEVGNMSLPSDTVCLETCAIYELPNTFTPNGDSANDVFVPRKNLFVEAVDFKVYNRWGNVIYETSNPQLNWNGTDLAGKDADDGTYYYTCSLFMKNEAGIEEVVEELSGYIELLR